MTNKKLDIFLRYVLYFAPFVIWIVFCIPYIRNEVAGVTWANQVSLSGIQTQLKNVLTYTITSSSSPFTDLHSWVRANITGNNNFGEIAFLYIYHLVYIEMALLFKNVLLFIIRVANNLIERGAELGK